MCVYVPACLPEHSTSGSLQHKINFSAEFEFSSLFSRLIMFPSLSSDDQPSSISSLLLSSCHLSLSLSLSLSVLVHHIAIFPVLLSFVVVAPLKAVGGKGNPSGIVQDVKI